LIEIETDENEKTTEKYSEEFTMPSTEELKSTEAWGHAYPIVLGAGRITHLPPEGVPEDELDAKMAEI
jgi:hypothetical protein